MRLAKPWTAFDRLFILWKSELSDKIQRNFFQAAAVSNYFTLYHMDADKTSRENAKREQLKNATSYWNKSQKQHPTK